MSHWMYHDPVFEHHPPEGAAWGGHRRFGYDLVRNLRPRTVVELGVCYGVSFFAFCQAVKDAAMDTDLWAVDTWEGDPHTGAYGPDILASFQRSLEPYQTLRVHQVRASFDDARLRFRERSVDLLHIDGCHTYEAVRHDYETWNDVVADDGVILFHDIAHRGDGFGVYRLWEELQPEFPTISFAHSHGLGVLFRSTKHVDVRALTEEWQRHYSR